MLLNRTLGLKPEAILDADSLSKLAASAAAFEFSFNGTFYYVLEHGLAFDRQAPARLVVRAGKRVQSG